MKKLAMLASVALLALSLFVGCSNTSSSGNGGDSGTGTPTGPKTVENCKEFTLKTKVAAEAGQFALKFQLTNDGSKDANGLKLTISDLDAVLTIGTDEIPIKSASLNLIPDQYDTPAYANSNCRYVVYNNAVPADTTVKFKVKKATIDNSAKVSDINFCFQKEGGDYALITDFTPVFVAE